MKKLVFTLVILALLTGAVILFVQKVKRLVPQPKMPPATEILMEKLGQSDRDLLRALFLVTNGAKGTQSTGLLMSDGIILADAHAVEGARLQDLTVLSSRGEPVKLRGLEADKALDVAFLLTASALKGGIELGEGGEFGPGDSVYAWGFSDNFNPPQPLLCMGFVSGFHLAPGESERNGATRLVLGGPFGPSHAGSPVFRWRDNQMVGLLVMREPPPDPFVERGLRALAGAKPGETVAVQDDSGKEVRFAQADLIARLLRAAALHSRPPIAEVVPVAALKTRLEQME